MYQRSVVMAVLAVLFLAVSGQAQTYPNPQVEKLVGPAAPLGSPASLGSIAALDTLMLAGADQFRPGGPRDPFVGGGAFIDANYYDLAYTHYQVYYRTGDQKWLGTARKIVEMYLASPSANIETWRRKMRGEWGFPGDEMIPPPRSASTLGLAVYAVETGNAIAKELVGYHARLYFCWGVGEDWLDQRESAYALIAATAAVALGDETAYKYGGCWDNKPPEETRTARQAAKYLLDMHLRHQGKFDGPGSLLTKQSTNPSDGANPPNVAWSNLFMTGLMTEAWIFYDRVIGDGRVPDAVKAYADWMMAKQWYPAEQAFAYSNATIVWPNGTAARYPEPGLNGMYLNTWGYLAAKTKDAKYVAQMNQIISGLLKAYPTPENAYNFFLAKMYPENFRNTPRGLGYLNNGGGGGGSIPLTVALTAASEVKQGAGVTTPLTATPSGKPIKSVDFVLVEGPSLTNPVVLVPSLTQAPFVFPWDLDPRWTPVGTYQIQAVAIATDGSSAQSNKITIQVKADVPPALPSKGETEISVVYLRVTPTSGRAVMKVQFFVNGNPYSTADSKGPVYSRRWGRPDGPNGPLPGPFVFTATIFYKDGGQETVPVEPGVTK